MGVVEKTLKKLGTERKQLILFSVGALSLVSPVWCNHLSFEVGTEFLNFAVNIMNEALFDLSNVEPLLEAIW